MRKKQAIFTIITCSIAVALLSAILAVGLHSDGFGFFVEGRTKEPQHFGHDNQVEFDPAEDSISSIEIDWETGPVQVKVVPAGKVRITEASSKSLEADEKMQVILSRGALEVSWDHSRFRFFSFGIFGDNAKSLTIELPQEVAEQLEEINCSNVSGDIEIGAITCGEGQFSSVSGAIHLSGATLSGECGLSTTSGDITLEKVSAESVNANTTSGTLHFEDTDLEEGDFGSTSGEIYFQGSAKDLHTSTVSGAAHATLRTCPEELQMESVSGKIKVELPRSASFTATHSSVSGNFTCDFPTPGGSQDTYGTGKPQGEFRFSTTSGDMQVLMG